MMPHNDAVPDAWKDVLSPVLAQDSSRHLGRFLQEREAEGHIIYPPRGRRLEALALTAPEDVRVIIIGQDPYHGPGQAHGLSFSVMPGVRVPPSLANIYKEIAQNPGVSPPPNGCLTGWARQGVLLLNAVLTVEDGKPGSHQKKGWEPITDAIVAAVAARREPCVFMLWGSHAQKKAGAILERGDTPHLVLSAPHPSPLSAHRGFLGCGHFGQANAFLTARGRGAIDWSAAAGQS